jgi:hypothetical protein
MGRLYRKGKGESALLRPTGNGTGKVLLTSTLKMEEEGSSETLVITYMTIW